MLILGQGSKVQGEGEAKGGVFFVNRNVGCWTLRGIWNGVCIYIYICTVNVERRVFSQNFDDDILDQHRNFSPN